MRPVCVTFLVLFCCVPAPRRSTFAQGLRAELATDSDAVAFHRLFGETHLASNARQICETARQTAEDSRFELLANWVLPGESHPEIRLIGDFRSTGWLPTTQTDQQRLWGPSEDHSVLTDLLQRGSIESPALQLIETAHATGRLRELRDRIRSIPETDSRSLRSKLTLLFLCEVALRDASAARAAFEGFIQATQDSDRSQLLTRWCEFLMFWAGMNRPETRSMVGDYYFNLYREPSESNSDTRAALVHDYLRLLQGSYQHVVLHAADERSISAGHFASQWVPYSLATSASRGRGRPAAYWETAEGRAFRVTGHETDFLSLRTPLRGDFQIECDAYADTTKSLSLMVAGTYAEMTDDLDSILSGHFASPTRTVAVEPQLSKFRELVRLRATVRGGTLTHYINGRPVVVEKLSPDHDPWVAIRAGNRSLGIFKDVRITGNPVVPEQIELVDDPELKSWAAYHLADDSGWKVVENTDGGMELHSPRRIELAGSAAENLLRYHRPMIEDGTITYDFFYQDGAACVSPAFDRLAFVLKPAGISLHRITDGRFNRTELPPDNESPVRHTQSESQPLPLIENAWNRLQVSVTGDELELLLNGHSIHKQMLDPANNRAFGLFHYQDQTEARVKDIVWRGDWPKTVPRLQEQTLAGRELQFLEDSRQQLKGAFSHDFVQNPTTFDRFEVARGELDRIEQTPDGLRMSCPADPRYSFLSVAPKLRLSGDFDVAAHFEQLEPLPAAGGWGGILLETSIENDISEQIRILLRLEHLNSVPRSAVKCYSISQRDGERSVIPFELAVDDSTSGTLRLARRGKTVYLLLAEGDSPNFRLFGVHESTDDDVFSIQLSANSYLQSVSNVVWTNLDVRAERVDVFTPNAFAEQLKKLNEQRDQLASHFKYDFGEDSLASNLFSRTGIFTETEGGLQMQRTGRATWSVARLASALGVDDDFDVEFDVGDLQLAVPGGKQNSTVYLQTELADANRTRLSVIFTKERDGQHLLYVQDQFQDKDASAGFRKNRYESIQLKASDQIEKLRIARRGKLIYFLYRLQGSDADRILTFREYNNCPLLPGRILLMLNSGRENEISRVNVKNFRIAAERLFPNPEDLMPQQENE